MLFEFAKSIYNFFGLFQTNWCWADWNWISMLALIVWLVSLFGLKVQARDFDTGFLV